MRNEGMDEDAGDPGASDRLAVCGLPAGWLHRCGPQYMDILTIRFVLGG